MNRSVRLLVGAVCLLTLVSSVAAQEAQPKDARIKAFLTCRDSKNPAEVIDACTDVLGTKGLPETLRPAIKERRGSAFVELKRYREGLIDLAYATNPISLYSRASAYLETKDYDDALADADKLIQLVPKIAAVYNLKAWICVKMGESEKGLADINKAIELKPDFAEAYDTRAHIYEVMATNPDLMNSSKMVEAAKYVINARNDYRKALELKPDLQESIDGLARMGLEK